jgi:hypothetical protein
MRPKPERLTLQSNLLRPAKVFVLLIDNARQCIWRIHTDQRNRGRRRAGKTTVIRAILAASQTRGRSFAQTALTGRAAKRMADATGVEAMTMHRFLRMLTVGKTPIMPGGLLIVDESSIIDLPHV